MKKRITVVFAVFLLFLACLIPIRVFADESELDSLLHRSNIVFVTDESGSMKQTDPNNNRYDAIHLFLGEMANEGNSVGSVSFGEGIVDSSEIRELNGQTAKDSLLADISDQQYSNYTNIGCGLLEAVEMLDRGKNTDLDSAIILLTDGNTDMPTAKKKQESQELKAEAIERARQSGYKIFAICLNVNGAADASEMKQIAEATGGEFVEVKSADDLHDVETLFNKLIFNSFEDMNYSNLELNLDDNGVVTTDFTIPGVGIEEINVLFQGNITNCELTDSRGNQYKSGDGASVAVDGANFYLVKVQNPIGGKWTATAYGDPNTTIRLRLLYNSNFYVKGEIDAPNNTRLGDTVKVYARVGTSEGIVTDVSRYEDMNAFAYISYGNEMNEYPMKLSGEGFVYELQIDREGTYYIQVGASNSEMEDKDDEVFEVNVNNTAPVATVTNLTAHANVWPFFGGKASVELEGAALDPEGQPLVFSVDSSAFKQDDYVLEGTVLTVNKFSIPKGTISVRATDPFGAYCTFDVLYTSTNIGLIMVILIALGAVIALVVIVLGIKAAMGKALLGSLSVATFDSNRKNPPMVKDHGRGRIPLAQFYIEDTGLPSGCKFQCDGGKAQIWFISKSAVYSDQTVSASKKIRIPGDGMEIRICSDEKMDKGIIVTFRSDKADVF